jgi:hypothetical protein
VEALAMTGGQWQQSRTSPSPVNLLISSGLIFGRGFAKAGISIAARMGRGKAAVGQVRLEWLSNIILSRSVPAATPLVRNPAPVVAVHLIRRNDAGDQALGWVIFLARPGQFGFGGLLGGLLISAYAVYVYRGGRLVIF